MTRGRFPAALALALVGLGAHCPPSRSDSGDLQKLAYVSDGEGVRGSSVVAGTPHEGSARTEAELWPQLGLSGPPIPREKCQAPESYGKGESLGPGRGTLPGDFPNDRTYPGSTDGGCGTFAALMCDDILDGVNRPITPDRWRRAHEGIGEDESGSSEREGQLDYHHRTRGGCSRGELLKPGDEDTIWMLKGKHCDCKIHMHGPNGGHVEVITGVVTNGAGQKCLQTNSWGHTTLVCGHDQSNGDHFTHPQFPRSFPAGGTRVFWDCICPGGDCR